MLLHSINVRPWLTQLGCLPFWYPFVWDTLYVCSTTKKSTSLFQIHTILYINQPCTRTILYINQPCTRLTSSYIICFPLEFRIWTYPGQYYMSASISFYWMEGMTVMILIHCPSLHRSLISINTLNHLNHSTCYPTRDGWPQPTMLLSYIIVWCCLQ